MTSANNADGATRDSTWRRWVLIACLPSLLQIPLVAFGWLTWQFGVATRIPDHIYALIAYAGLAICIYLGLPGTLVAVLITALAIYRGNRVSRGTWLVLGLASAFS